MSRFELILRVDAPGAGGYTTADILSAASQRLRDRLYGRLGLRARGGWVTIRLDKAPPVLRRLLEACRAEGAVVGTATVTERMDRDEIAAADWFYLETRTADNSFSLSDDYPAFRPGNLPPGHALNHTFVSQAVVDTYRRVGLTGLSFLRCRNAGRKQVPGWFVALPEGFLGHGLDHPWFDRAAWVRDTGANRHARVSSLETAQYAFHQRWLRRDPGPDDHLVTTLPRLLPIPAVESPLVGVTFVTVPRYWTAVFPRADFAYVPWGEDGPNRDGKILRFRKLAVSGRARSALIDAGLFRAREFLPVRSVAAPEPGVARLDERFPPVPPMYPPEELAGLRQREAALPG